MIDIFVVDSCGNKEKIQIEKSDTIKRIKEIIKKKKTIEDSEFLLIFDGSILNDNETLEDYDINYGDVLTIIQSNKSKFKIFVSDARGYKKLIQVEKTYKIKKIIEIIKEEFNLGKGNIVLVFGGIILNENETLEDYDIYSGYTLNYVSEFVAGGDGIENADISKEKELIKTNCNDNDVKYNIIRNN